MKKNIILREAAGKALQNGIDKAAALIVPTYGPAGRNVILGRTFDRPLITSDSADILRGFSLEDPAEDLGAQLICRTVEDMHKKLGDGSASAVIMVQTIIKKSLTAISAGYSPVGIKKGIMLGASAAARSVKQDSRSIGSGEELMHTVQCAAGDEEIGNITAEALSISGTEGTVEITDNYSGHTFLEKAEGMRIDRGCISPYMYTDKQASLAELKDPYILITDKKISDIRELLPVLTTVYKSGHGLAVVAGDVSGEALAAINLNLRRKTFSCVCIKAAGSGPRQRDVLEDMALLTGGQAVLSDNGYRLESLGLKELGSAECVRAGTGETYFLGGKGDPERIGSRIRLLREQAEKSNTADERRYLTERAGRLDSRTVFIRVGAFSETELKEKKSRYARALAAGRAALRSGVVPGGGIAYLRAGKAVEALMADAGGEERIGLSIVAEALRAPVYRILENAGIHPGAVVSEIEARGSSGYMGYDVLKERFGDCCELGLEDPAEVCMTAVLSAASLAGELITAEALAVPAKKVPDAVVI